MPPAVLVYMGLGYAVCRDVHVKQQAKILAFPQALPYLSSLPPGSESGSGSTDLDPDLDATP